jgi:GNAT superfamily N-acetyltransferase
MVRPVVRVTLVVRRATAAEIRPLRQAVLRPGQPVADSVYPQDDVAVHVGGWDDGELVACATLFADPWPDEPRAWRLRGMAVEPSRQGTGIGRLVLAEGVEAAWASGAPLLWANARTSALGFYVRLGWRPVGGEFVPADSGLPHVAIVLDRAAAEPP